MNTRLRQKIAEKLKLEGGTPTNWLDGRGGQQRNTFAKTTPREDDGGTNFTIKNSGQKEVGEKDEVDEAGLPSNYKSKQTPVSDTHTLLGSTEREKDSDEANFTVRNSGQEDLDETLQLNLSDLSYILPSGDYDVHALKIEMANALNSIYKKYKLNTLIKIR